MKTYSILFMTLIAFSVSLFPVVGYSQSYKVRYECYAGKEDFRQKEGITTISAGETYEILNKKGGCGGNDICRCSVTTDGKIEAYYKDSCQKGQEIAGSISPCSKVMYKHYYTECCFSK